MNLLGCRPVISMMKLCLHPLNSEFRCVFQFIAKLLVEKDKTFVVASLCSLEKGSSGKAPFWMAVWLKQNIHPCKITSLEVHPSDSDFQIPTAENFVKLFTLLRVLLQCTLNGLANTTGTHRFYMHSAIPCHPTFCHSIHAHWLDLLWFCIPLQCTHTSHREQIGISPLQHFCASSK